MPDDTAPDWDDVERVLTALQRDGYEVTEFIASTREPAREKAFVLEVERPPIEGETVDEG
jgi:hypothetical protein